MSTVVQGVRDDRRSIICKDAIQNLARLDSSERLISSRQHLDSPKIWCAGLVRADPAAVLFSHQPPPPPKFQVDCRRSYAASRPFLLSRLSWESLTSFRSFFHQLRPSITIQAESITTAASSNTSCQAHTAPAAIPTHPARLLKPRPAAIPTPAPTVARPPLFALSSRLPSSGRPLYTFAEPKLRHGHFTCESQPDHFVRLPARHRSSLVRFPTHAHTLSVPLVTGVNASPNPPSSLVEPDVADFHRVLVPSSTPVTHAKNRAIVTSLTQCLVDWEEAKPFSASLSCCELHCMGWHESRLDSVAENRG